MHRTHLYAAPIVLLVILFAVEATAGQFAAINDVPVTQGQLRLVDPERGGPLGFPLKHTKVKVFISGNIAHVQVEQTFTNPFSEPIEAVYVFPLSDTGAINEYAILIGNRIIQGMIKEAEEAKQTYEKAKKEGRTTALLEEEKENVFTQRVANIPVGQDVIVRMNYVEQLKYDDGHYDYVFPMVVGPRYMPKNSTEPIPVYAYPNDKGMPTIQLDPSQKSRDVFIPYVKPTEILGNEIELDLEVDAGVPIASALSTSHQIDLSQPGETSLKASIKPLDRLPNKDFVFRYFVAGDKSHIGILANKEGPMGHFSFIIQPKTKITKEELAPRDVVIVIDSSGSMSGAPLEQAKSIGIALLQSLQPQDRFAVIMFDDHLSTFGNGFHDASLNDVSSGIAYIQQTYLGGGTEMYAAIDAALSQKTHEGRLCMVYLVTDALVGNDEEILAYIQKNVKNNRIFPVGIGSASNRSLINRIAEVGRGFAMFIRADENPADLIKTIVERTTKPFITHIRLEWHGVVVKDIQPDPIPDLYAGEPLVLAGRYENGNKGMVVMTAFLGGKKFVTELPIELPEQETKNKAIPYIWAKRKVRTLMLKQLGTEDPKIKQEVTRLGLDYHLVTRYTSFVAVDEEKVVNPSGEVKVIRQPVNMPEGMSWEGVFGKEEMDSLNNGTNNNAPVYQKPNQRNNNHSPDFGFHGGGGAVDPLLLAMISAFILTMIGRRKKESNGVVGEK